MKMLDGSYRPIYGLFLKFAFIVVLVLLMGFVTCHAQIPEEVDEMATNYVKILVVGDHEINSQATGIAFTKRLTVINFHTLEIGCRIATPSGVGEDGKKKATLGEVVYCDPQADICVVDFHDNILNPKKLKFAKHISPGETVMGVTNAFGKGPVFISVVIAKVEEDEILFFPAAPMGASGSAFFNTSGELVFMLKGSYDLESSAKLGYGIPADQIKSVIQRFNRPPMKAVSPFPEASDPGGKDER